jgi:5-oxoprolinase (ATP-hydrolysing) subunit A
MPKIDLNADVGEGSPNELELLKLVGRVNICCGFHAGGPREIDEIINELVKVPEESRIKVGAHPSYIDRENFGRLELNQHWEDVCRDVWFQVGAFRSLAFRGNVWVNHLKPHGALYNQACRDSFLALSVVAVAFGCRLEVVGLPNSQLEERAKELKTNFIREGFADRRYRPDGTLVPRTDANPFVTDPKEAEDQIRRLVEEQRIQTVCVHGDNPQSLAFTIKLRELLNDLLHD